MNRCVIIELKVLFPRLAQQFWSTLPLSLCSPWRRPGQEVDASSPELLILLNVKIHFNNEPFFHRLLLTNDLVFYLLNI